MGLLKFPSWLRRFRKPTSENRLEDTNFEHAESGKKSMSGGEPPSYSLLDSFTYSPDIVTTVEAKLDALSPSLRVLSLKIHDHPELMFEERYAHDILTAFMSEHGFVVTRHYLGLETAWRAEYAHGTGGRVLGINSEMDALPGIGHACGHNLIAVSGVGVAIAVKAAMEAHNFPGKVVLLGTPAEEGGGGKIILLERGGYKDMDACIMCHPGSGPEQSVSLGWSLAMQSIDVEFFGHTAHAAAAPWEGKNALDAAFLAYSSISVLRQQIKPTHRIHGVLSGKDWTANVIPDYAKMTWFVRAPTRSEMNELCSRVKACFQGAALSTACRCEISLGLPVYDLHQNTPIGSEFASVIQNRYGMVSLGFEHSLGASTDFGNVTYQLPALHPSFAIPTEPGGSNHTPGFARAARTIEAHKSCMTVSKGLALIGLRVIYDNDFFKQVKESFDRQCEEATSTVSKTTT